MTARSTALAAVALLGVAAVTGSAAWLSRHPEPLVVQGQVEMTEIKVAARISGRVEAMLVRRGQRVTRGEVLALLASPELVARRTQAAAAGQAAAAQRDKAQHGSRDEETAAARARWQATQAAADLACVTRQRVAALHADGVVATQKLDEADAQWQAAAQTAQAARSLYDLALAGARREDREAATAVAAQAAAAITEVESLLAETRVIAPLDGEVAEVVVEPGELVSPGLPLVTLLDSSDPWITFNLREDLLPRAPVGTLLNLTVPALAHQVLPVRIDWVSDLGDFASWSATRGSGEFDLRTFEVRARPATPVAGLRPGMTAVAHWEAP